jgi:hypothetical protein
VATWAQLAPAVADCIGAQGYRQVDVNSLPQGMIHLPSTSNPQLDAALSPEVPNWVEFGRQLRYFQGPNFISVWIRRDKYDFEICVVEAFKGPLALELASKGLQIQYGVYRRLAKSIADFKLSDDTKAQLNQALQLLEQVANSGGAAPAAGVAAPPAAPLPTTVQQQATASPAPAAGGWDVSPPTADETAKREAVGPLPTNAVTVSLAMARLLLSFIRDVANSGASLATVVMVSVEGLEDALVQKLEQPSGLAKADQWALALEEPRTTIVGVDGKTLKAHGHTPASSFDVGGMGARLQRNLASA